MVTIATTSSNQEQRDRICEALAVAYDSVAEFWEAIYGGLIAFLGLRLREPRTMLQFAQAVTSLSEGDSLRRHVVREIVALDLPSGPRGADQEWTLYAVTPGGPGPPVLRARSGLRRTVTERYDRGRTG